MIDEVNALQMLNTAHLILIARAKFVATRIPACCLPLSSLRRSMSVLLARQYTHALCREGCCISTVIFLLSGGWYEFRRST